MLWGDGSPTREFLYVDDCAEGLVLAADRYDGAGSGEPRRRQGDLDPRARRAGRRRDGLRRADRLGHDEAERPAAAERRRDARARAVRLRGADAAARGTRAHGRVVPGARACVCAFASARGLRQTLRSRPFRQPSSRPRRARRSCSGCCVLRLARSVTHNGWLYYQRRRPDVRPQHRLVARARPHPAGRDRLRLAVCSPRRSRGSPEPNVLSALPAHRARADARAPPRRAALRVRDRRPHRRPRRRLPRSARLGRPPALRGPPVHRPASTGRTSSSSCRRRSGWPCTTAFPSTVCVLVAAYFAVTSIDSRGTAHAVVAGLFAGFAVAIDPANALFLARARRGLRGRAALASPRWRSVSPRSRALATLLLWKHRGLGHVPHVDADVDFHRLESIRARPPNVLLRATGSIEILVHRGRDRDRAAGRGRRAPSSRVWFLAYVLVRGSSELASVPTASVFLLLMPVFPAFVVACAALPLLVPRLADRLPRQAFLAYARATGASSARSSSSPRAPLVVVAALPVAQDADRRVRPPTGTRSRRWTRASTPSATVSARGVSLAWPAGKELARERLLQRLPQPRGRIGRAPLHDGKRRGGLRVADEARRQRRRAHVRRQAAAGTLDVPRRACGELGSTSRQRRRAARLSRRRRQRRR